jgi:hypothetical protein
MPRLEMSFKNAATKYLVTVAFRLDELAGRRRLPHR